MKTYTVYLTISAPISPKMAFSPTLHFLLEHRYRRKCTVGGNAILGLMKGRNVLRSTKIRKVGENPILGLIIADMVRNIRFHIKYSLSDLCLNQNVQGWISDSASVIPYLSSGLVNNSKMMFMFVLFAWLFGHFENLAFYRKYGDLSYTKAVKQDIFVDFSKVQQLKTIFQKRATILIKK